MRNALFARAERGSAWASLWKERAPNGAPFISRHPLEDPPAHDSGARVLITLHLRNLPHALALKGLCFLRFKMAEGFSKNSLLLPLSDSFPSPPGA